MIKSRGEQLESVVGTILRSPPCGRAQFVFLYLYLCICICVFAFVYLYLCICIYVFVLVYLQLESVVETILCSPPCGRTQMWSHEIRKPQKSPEVLQRNRNILEVKDVDSLNIGETRMT